MIVLCRRRGFFAGAWRIYRMIPVACHPGSRRHAHTITSFERAPLVTPDMSFTTPMRTPPCAIAEPAASAHKAARGDTEGPHGDLPIAHRLLRGRGNALGMILHLKSPVHRTLTARAGANHR
jgi:hypothetical protein